MCGFVGIYSPHRAIDGSQIDIRAGMDAIRHRGPDGEGFYESPDRRFQVGFLRLSIIDIETAHQPLAQFDGGRVMVGNGEIYNYIELRQKYASYPYRTSGDMETVLAALSTEGDGFINQLTGMFALGIYDVRKHNLMLVRDHTGIKPLYWARTPDGSIGFASEIKALFAAGIVTPEIDDEQVPSYLAHGYVPAPHTVFKGVNKLQPAHILRYGEDAAVQMERYWLPNANTPVPSSPQETAEFLTDKLTDSVNLQLRSDVPVGALLSGGIDSGLLVALASGRLGHSLKTLTVAFEGADYNEAPLARTVAEMYGTSHDEVTIDVSVVDSLLPNVVWQLGEPLNDAALIPNYLVEREMGKQVKVALNGTGGDELFAGYGRYFQLPVEKRYLHIPRSVRRHVIEPAIEKLSPMTAWKLKRAEKFFDDGGGYLHDHSTQFPLAMRHLIGNRTVDVPVQQQKYFNDFGGDRQSGSLYVDINTYLPDDLLALLDSTSMAFGVEGRVPFLDHQFVSAALSVPSSVRNVGGMSKGLERMMASHLLPGEILDAPKQGFLSPVPAWMTGGFLGAVRLILTRPKALSRGWWTAAGIKNLTEAPEQQSFRLYTVLMLELIATIFVDQKCFKSAPQISVTELASSI